MLKESQTIKVMKEGQNRSELAKGKAIFFEEILIHHDNKEIHAKKYCFWLFCMLGALY